MTLKEIRNEVSYFSEKAGIVNQKLALAGIAIIWLFRETSEDKIAIANSLLVSLTFFVTALAIDLIHYSVFAPIYRSYFMKHMYDGKDKNGKKKLTEEETEVGQPFKTNDLSWVFFFFKILFVIVGYVFLVIGIFDKISLN